MKSFDERKNARQAAQVAHGTFSPLPAAEFPALRKKITSEERLESLSPELRSPQRFREKVDEFKCAAHLQTHLIADADQLPELAPDTRHRYPYCFKDCRQRLTHGEDVLIAVVIEAPRLIGFGITVRDKNSAAEIEIIDVDEFSRRSSGLQTTIELQGQEFTIGVAHILVNLISAELRCAIRVDATTSGIRYVFKSLSFTREPSNTNPCRLWRPPTSA